MADKQNPIIIDDDDSEASWLEQEIDIDSFPDVMGPIDHRPGIDDPPGSKDLVDLPEDSEAVSSLATKNACKDRVKSVFSDICLTYLDEIAAENDYNPDVTIGAILDHQEKGGKYPIQPRDLKRKRTDWDNSDVENDEDDDEEGKEAENGIITTTKRNLELVKYFSGTVSHSSYVEMARNLLASEFPKVPMPTIRTLLRANRGSIFETYTKIDEAIRNWNNVSPPWVEKQRPSRTLPSFSPDCINALDLTHYTNEQQAAIAELRAARELKAIKDAETARKAEEEENFAHAKSIGEVVECGCCFDEFPLNRMIHCNGENCHWFCRNCMRLQAETNVGVSKYEITCMSTDGCAAGFSTDQKKQFLNKKLRVALERLEQEAALRMAGIENLENCPFCPYAAECPPIEIDKEFTCVNPGCEKVSCRLCHKETHIPKTCAEASKDQGLDARHVVEEAMSEALIRRCNECQTPYLKLTGCNKIYCTKCSNIQCYVCRQTIADYGHFDDVRRGGKSGQCPLFDKTEERHQQEVQQAEENIRQKMLKDHADITEDTLKINLSEQVLQDDQKRKKESLQQHPHPNLFADVLDVNNGINRAARQYHQPGANRRAVPPPMFYHIPPPPPHLPRHLHVHPPAQHIGVPGGPQARNRAVRAVIPMLPVPNQQGQQLPPIQQQLPGLGARAPPQGMVAAGHVPGGMAPIAPMGHPMGHPLGAPQAQQEAIQQRMEHLFRLAPIRQQGPPVLQNRVLNDPPQERPAERVDPLYHPVNRRNEFPNLQNANGFNFRRWGF